jgi:hypothetical protein
MEDVPPSTLKHRQRIIGACLLAMVALHALAAWIYEYGIGILSLLVVAPAYLAMLIAALFAWRQHRNNP